MKIGLGITVHNRNEIAAVTVKQWKKYLPKGCKLIIVDDASVTPFKGAHYRFENNVGIAQAKNKCLELLDDCDHIFLSDDDCWAKVNNWWKPYVESAEPHLMFTFDTLQDGRQNGNREVLSSGKLVSFANPCGCLLYFEKRVLDVVGGFDINFAQYGYEHVEFSNRIHNAGLTTYRYQDVPGSLKLFHSMDWAGEVLSSVQANRSMLLWQNRQHFNAVKHSREFKAYKPLPNMVITTLFTTLEDPQRAGVTWPEDITVVKKLGISVENLVVLTDFYEGVVGNIRYVKVNPLVKNPYWARWFAIAKHLETNLYGKVFCVDATDVEMLKNPFPEMEEGKLYPGDERDQTLSNGWLRKHHSNPVFYPMYNIKRDSRLLNAGLLGGDHKTVLEFCRLMMILHDRFKGNLGLTDMAGFNFVCYAEFKDRLVYGPLVCTEFKKEERPGDGPWWKHK